MFDALVIGAGPAGLAIASELCHRGLKVQGLISAEPTAPWHNTYGIWQDELEALELSALLGHSWQNCVSYFTQGAVEHHRTYGLFDKLKLQQHLLQKCEQGQINWHQGLAATISHQTDQSWVTTKAGDQLKAKVVIDTTGHQPVFVKRPTSSKTRYQVGYQGAFGIVGRFSTPPIELGQFVLMDYRSDHLSPEDKALNLPTFLYAMDLGDGVFFVEETSLSATPGVGFDILERRLLQRLKARSVSVIERHEVERCLFPMNLPLPDFTQLVIGFGGSASMVHPSTGYMVGALLRRAPGLADTIAAALDTANPTPSQVSQAAWQTLWSQDRRRKNYLYRFGLEKLMRFEEEQLKHFFETFFSLPKAEWSGFLADTLTMPELLLAMIRLFGTAPNDVRWGLMQFAEREAPLLWRSLTA